MTITTATALLAQEFIDAVNGFEVTQHTLATGKQMKAKGEPMRPGSLEEAAADAAAARAELIAARDALRRALDALEA
jgi:hypothetical protein